MPSAPFVSDVIPITCRTVRQEMLQCPRDVSAGRIVNCDDDVPESNVVDIIVRLFWCRCGLDAASGLGRVGFRCRY